MERRTKIMGRRRGMRRSSGIGGRGGTEEDPMGGLTNLFDIAMVFAVALMLALVTYSSLPELISGKDVTLVKNPGTADMEIITKQGEKVEIQKVTNETIGGMGKKLGTTYMLESGEVIYVPESSP
jgi:hypothetical protein